VDIKILIKEFSDSFPIKHIRIIYHRAEGDQGQQIGHDVIPLLELNRISLIIYFNDLKTSMNFYKQFNCLQLSKKEEIMYLIYLQKIIFFCNDKNVLVGQGGSKQGDFTAFLQRSKYKYLM